MKNQKIIERLARELEDLDCRDEQELSYYFREKQEIEKIEQEVLNNSYKFNI